MRYFEGGFTTSHKGDKSPVTEADIAANKYITEQLQQLTPKIPIIAEEDEVISDKKNDVFWLVDPLDGTRSFVSGENEFSVNIGLVQNQKPLLGVIGIPAQKLIYFGSVQTGAFRIRDNGTPEAIHARKTPAEGVTIVRSKSHPSKQTEAYLNTLKIAQVISGSSAIKFCQVAEGSADIYPRFGRTMEWDTAAGHAILNGAGGRVETTDGHALLYGKSGFENPGFIAYGKT